MHDVRKTGLLRASRDKQCANLFIIIFFIIEMNVSVLYFRPFSASVNCKKRIQYGLSSLSNEDTNHKFAWDNVKILNEKRIHIRKASYVRDDIH